MLDLDAKLTASQAARAVRVTKQLFNYWRSKGYIQPCGTNRRGQALYRFGDVVDIEAEMGTAPRSTRRARDFHALAA